MARGRGDISRANRRGLNFDHSVSLLVHCHRKLIGTIQRDVLTVFIIYTDPEIVPFQKFCNIRRTAIRHALICCERKFYPIRVSHCVIITMIGNIDVFEGISFWRLPLADELLADNAAELNLNGAACVDGAA